MKVLEVVVGNGDDVVLEVVVLEVEVLEVVVGNGDDVVLEVVVLEVVVFGPSVVVFRGFVLSAWR